MEVHVGFDGFCYSGKCPRGHRKAEWEHLENVKLSVYHESQEEMEDPCYGNVVESVLEIHCATPHWSDDAGCNVQNPLHLEGRNFLGAC